MVDDPLERNPPVGVTRGLIRQRDKAHVGTIWLNRDLDDEFEDPGNGTTPHVAHPTRHHLGGDPRARRGDLPAPDPGRGAAGRDALRAGGHDRAVSGEPVDCWRQSSQMSRMTMTISARALPPM